jgi:hypothetical protein
MFLLSSDIQGSALHVTLLGLTSAGVGRDASDATPRLERRKELSVKKNDCQIALSDGDMSYS